jgi:hypothetical protein
LNPNEARKIAEKTALVCVGPEGACTNGRESCAFVHAASVEELRAAIVAVTRALASAHESDHVFELVHERAELRQELEALLRNADDLAGHRVA